MKSWGPMSLSQPAVGRRVATVTRTVSASKARGSLLGSGLKATSLLNIFMHTQPEASEAVKTPETRPVTEKTVKKGLKLEQIDVVFPAIPHVTALEDGCC